MCLPVLAAGGEEDGSEWRREESAVREGMGSGERLVLAVRRQVMVKALG
jgi:hypothetical protein